MIKNWSEYIDSLVKSKIPFEVQKSTNDIKIITPFGTEKNRIATSGLPLSQLWFIKAVKQYCERLNLTFNIDRARIKYLDVGRISEQKINNVYEIDLSSAYWNFAYREGIINTVLYNKGQQVDKLVRLAALGSLAKQVTTMYFDGVRWTVKGITEGGKADYFFRVAELTGEIMHRLKLEAGPDYLFFWVDAIFFQGDALNKIESVLAELNLPYKKYLIDTVEKRDGVIFVKSKQWQKEKNKKNAVRKFKMRKDNYLINQTIKK